MATHSNHKTTLSISKLRFKLTGRVITPDDTDYDQARTVFVGGIDRRPAVIVRVATVADVQCVIALARDTGLPLAVRSGGHGWAAHSVVEAGLVLDLTNLRAHTIDAVGCTAWVEPGLTAGEFTTAAAEHGLALSLGDTGPVGIGGQTLGGGIGYLVRQYGLTIDDLLAAEVVTADGQFHRVDAHTEPELFWAIRGGGGNFGVVTRFQFRLHPVDAIYGGLLFLPATAAVIQAFVAAAEAAPDELTTIANLMRAPAVPFLPAAYHHQPVMIAKLIYAGPPAAGEQAVAPFRALTPVIADLVKPMRYSEVYPPEDSSYHPLFVSRTLFVDTLSQRSADAIVDQFQDANCRLPVTQLRVLGGAMARVPAEATAFAHRTRRMLLNVGAIYADPGLVAQQTDRVEALVAVLREGQAPGAFVNFLAAEGRARVREAYPGDTWRRLAAIKQHYDPANLFRLNHNIPPDQASEL